MKHVDILRANGIEVSTFARSMSEIEKLIEADGLDTVNLRDGRIMLVDDLGHAKRRPFNLAATRLYHSVCRPGTTHHIVGDVAIVVDEEWKTP